MNIRHTFFRALPLAGAIAATALPACALEAEDVARQFKEMLDLQGFSISWNAVEGDGKNVTLKGVTASLPGEPGGIPLGDLKLADIEEDEGVIVVGEVSLPRFVHSGVGMTLGIDGLSVGGMRLTPLDADDPLAGVAFYESATIERIAVNLGGKDVATILNLDMEATRPGGGEPMTFYGSAESFSFDLGAAEDQQATETVRALGFDTIEGGLEIGGYWNPEDGRLAFEQYDISVKDAGTISLTFDISGYTREFMHSVRELQARMETATEEEKAMQGMAMLGLAQQLNLHGAKLRFDDDTLTQKVLAFLAAQQGVKPSDIANQAKAMLPFALAQLNSPQLTAEVSGAVNAFLDNPESLEIAIEPENPIPFAMVAAGAMTAPEALPQQLGLRVRANR